MATSVLSARSAAVTMSSESASSCSVIGEPHTATTGTDAAILVRPARIGPHPARTRPAAAAVTHRQLFLPSPRRDTSRTLESAMHATERLPGTLGPYRLQDRLGEGGMGVVHLARDPEGRLVAVKVLSPLTTESVNARRR